MRWAGGCGGKRQAERAGAAAGRARLLTPQRSLGAGLAPHRFARDAAGSLPASEGEGPGQSPAAGGCVPRRLSPPPAPRKAPKKVSKLERRINAVVAFQEEVFSKVAVHQTMLPSADYQNTVLSQLGSSAFCPDINIPTRSSNTLLLSPCTGFTAAHVSEYVSSDEVILVSVEDQNSATSNTSAIPNNQMSTQAETSATVQAEQKKIRNIYRTNNLKPVCLN
ncbi:activating transcription factor 7-interacting protein 2 isoform X2 [Haliaeetus albicilla]|uniref:activating transcription factor 7-interacting protein 2 isoform X2 n=1 Tax=Haliaeetus albicilla TaxID=8969 RepID=UPI0037E7B8FF